MELVKVEMWGAAVAVHVVRAGAIADKQAVWDTKDTASYAGTVLFAVHAWPRLTATLVRVT